MPYIGNTPADKFLTLAKQNFSTSATTSYTLDSAVSSTQDIALFINNVRQSPVDAYTVSGTALTLTSATAGTDEMYCVYLGKTVGTVSPATNSITNAMMTDDSVGLAELSATGTASSSNFLRGDNSWATAGGGLVKQVVTSANTTADTNSTTSYEDSGNSVAITPSTATNKVLVHFSIPINLYRSSSTSCRYGWKVLRGSTVIASGASTTNYGMLGASAEMVWGVVWNYTIYDEPDSTSAQTYKVQFANNESGNLVAQVSSNESNITAIEIEST